MAGLNMKVCLVMGIAQLLLWTVWAGVTHHPSRWKLWVVVVGGALAMLLEIYDFPPYRGFVDGHAVWHALAIPITYLSWSFVKDDSEFRTAALTKKKVK